jgi:hypothetical protein
VRTILEPTLCMKWTIHTRWSYRSAGENSRADRCCARRFARNLGLIDTDLIYVQVVATGITDLERTRSCSHHPVARLERLPL